MERAGCLYRTPHGMNDDHFWLYAAFATFRDKEQNSSATGNDAHVTHAPTQASDTAQTSDAALLPAAAAALLVAALHDARCTPHSLTGPFGLPQVLTAAAV